MMTVSNARSGFVAALTALLSACAGGAPELTTEQAAFIEDYYAQRGITDETHGRFETIAYFEPADAPQAPPRREHAFYGNGLTLLVEYAGGRSVVSVLYPLKADQLYSASGTGAPIPLQVRVDQPLDANALYQRDRARRLRLDRNYAISLPVYSRDNRSEILAMTAEVLRKTHCLGGDITIDDVEGGFARNFVPGNSDGPAGETVEPGWTVAYRCDRWRAE